MVERGQEDWDSEYGRFPRLFQAAESIPGLTWPTMTFDGFMTVYLGKRRIELMHLGRGAHGGRHRRLGAGCEGHVLRRPGRVQVACYCGDAHLTDWPETLDNLRDFGPEALMPGRGDALASPELVGEALER